MGDPQGKTKFWVVNIHLTHHATPKGITLRKKELERVLDWMEDDHGIDRVIIMGDHNTLMKNELLISMYEKSGFKSAFLVANGKEPTSTWPSGIQAPFMDLDGAEINPSGVCLDFIFVKGFSVKSAKLVGDKPHKGDKTLYPSDHIGIFAELQY